MDIRESRKLMQLEEILSEAGDLLKAELDEESGNFEIKYLNNRTKREVEKAFKGNNEDNSKYQSMLEDAESIATKMIRPKVGILTGTDIKYFRPNNIRVFFTIIGKVVWILGCYKKSSGRGAIPDQTKRTMQDRRKTLES